MKVLTFHGASPAEALKKAQHEVGEEAVLIETKELQKRSLGQEPLYEIVVGIDEKYLVGKKPLSKQKPLAKDSSDVLFNISEAAKQISQIADVTSNDSELGSDDQSAQELVEIKKEMNKLGDHVKLIQNMMWDEKSSQMGDLVIPSEFSEIYRLAKRSGMNGEHLDAIMRLTLEHMPMKMRENSQTIKRYFQVLLRKLIPVRIESSLKVGAKKVIMLVGPTGVGKTTSIAKLAARYSFLLQKRYKVGLIVLDTYRIGAVEQLMQYARMMKLSIETVVDPPEFTTALESLRFCDYILIDTMGSSPYDKQKIEVIQQCLQVSQENFEIDVILTLPSSIKYDDLVSTYENFQPLQIDTVMFTKLDETMAFGNIFSLVYEKNLPISYFSVGQEVPEDLEVATSDFMVDCLLNGFTRGK